MLKTILSVILGLVSSFIIIVLLESINHIIYPLPPNIDFEDMEALKAFASNAPSVVYVLVIIAYALASFVGGLVSASIAPKNKMSKAITVGGILMGLGAYNLFMIPHPVWTIVISIFVFIPCSYLGGYTGIKITAKKK